MRTLIIIPCYNESGSIESLVREIKEQGMGYDILVVDDGSQDDTYYMARRVTSCLKLPVNIGIGGAEQSGIKYAYDNNYDLCIRLDGDGQHPPDQIKKLVDRHIESADSLVIGSRFMSDRSFRSTWLRRAGIRLISLMLKYLYGYTATDPTSGFRLMDRKAMRIFYSEYPYDFPEPASIAIALNHGLSVGEMPVLMRQREFGKSSIRGIKNAAYMIRVIFYILFSKIRSYI